MYNTPKNVVKNINIQHNHHVISVCLYVCMSLSLSLSLSLSVYLYFSSYAFVEVSTAYDASVPHIPSQLTCVK